MSSDIDYERFDYHSSQDDWQIEYQIDLFEIRQLCKSRKQNRQKLSKSAYPVSMKSLKLNPGLVREKCMREKKIVKAQSKPSPSNRNSKAKLVELFECDENSKSESSVECKSSNEESQENFSDFRRHFYRTHRYRIKSAVQQQSNIKIIDIRPAPVDPLVQNQFMKTLSNNSSSPKLAFHGTKLANIGSILRYGFLVPDQAHPTNENAPIIQSINGQAYGKGIYCSTTADYSVSYMHTTNTLLVCAIFPPKKIVGKCRSAPGNIIVLPKVDQIVPLFLVDIQSTDRSRINHPLYSHKVEKKPTIVEEEKVVRMPMDISRQYLRKILALINDEKRKNHLYQVRRYESDFS